MYSETCPIFSSCLSFNWVLSFSWSRTRVWLPAPSLLALWAWTGYLNFFSLSFLKSQMELIIVPFWCEFGLWAFLYVEKKNRPEQTRGSGCWQILLACPNQYLRGSQKYRANKDRNVQVTVLYFEHVGWVTHPCSTGDLTYSGCQRRSSLGKNLRVKNSGQSGQNLSVILLAHIQSIRKSCPLYLLTTCPKSLYLHYCCCRPGHHSSLLTDLPFHSRSYTLLQ